MVSGGVDAERGDLDPSLRSKGLVSSAFWSILCLLVFLWWASHYASLVEWLGEWQFTHLGIYFPSITVVLCVALLAVPIFLIVLAVRHRRRRRAERAASLTPQMRAQIAINSADRGRIFFAVVTVVALLSACGALSLLMSLPDADRPLVTISSGNGAHPLQGPARFAPGRTIGQVGLLTETAGIVRRDTYVAPVTLNGEQGQGARFFTQVERLAGDPPQFTTIPRGVLQANGLPGELVNLYRGAGVRVVDRPYLLVSDLARLRWRPLVMAVQLALLALVAAIGSLLLRRQVKKLRRRVTEGEAA